MRTLIFITIIFFISCSDGKLRKYESIVQKADRIEIYYKKTGKTLPIPRQLIANFKEILIRNVKPEMQREFINDVRIDIYKGNKRTAFLMIANGGTIPFVNFNSDSLNFGFRLTYGIGQTLNDFYADYSP